jgi:hypothetical protein
MTDESKSVSMKHLPRQAPPLLRGTVTSAVTAQGAVIPCDNDHNTDTERDMFFVKMT